MTNQTTERSRSYALLLGLALSNLVLGGDCWSAPKCWQYHRDTCYGYYQTKWRHWDDACGRTSWPATETAEVGKRTLHEPGQLVTVGTPKLASAPPLTLATKNATPVDSAQAAGTSAPPQQASQLPSSSTTIEPGVDSAWASRLRR